MYLTITLIIVIILICIFNKKVFYKIKYTSVEKFINGSVAVVGNGPLSNEDRYNISKADCVIRFNDLKNFKRGERCDIHAIRYTLGRYPGINLSPKHAKILPVSPNNFSVFNSRDLCNVEGLPPLLIYDPRANNDLHENVSIFENSNCGKECIQSSSSYGPSTGAVVIDMLEKLNSVNKINVYGMNWNGTTKHIDFKNPTIVQKFCSKCNIHPTQNNKYKP